PGGLPRQREGPPSLPRTHRSPSPWPPWPPLKARPRAADVRCMHPAFTAALSLSMPALSALFRELPRRLALRDLTTRERRALGGRCFRAGPQLARLVARAIDRSPDLFAVPFTGAEPLRPGARAAELRRPPLAGQPPLHLVN